MEESLASYLREIIFPMAEVPEPYVNELLSPTNIKLWVAAFTHASVSLNHDENYEQFEKLGDSVLRTSYINFIMEGHPDISSAQLNNLTAYYLSKEILADISNQLGLYKYLNTVVAKNISSREDLFESLVGALFWIGNRIKVNGRDKYGSGFLIADTFIRSIYSQIPIEPKTLKGPPKTQVKEIFEILRWGTPKEEWHRGTASTPGTFIIRYTPAAMTFFVNLKRRKASDILAEVKGPSKTVASNEANREALKSLEEQGLTVEWAAEYRRKLEFQEPDLIPYLIPVERKAVKEGYKNVYFKNVTSTNEGRVVQLVGEKSDGTNVILEREFSTETHNIPIYKKLLEKYISRK